ncbi:flagellar hook-basal body protein [Candidatus Contubernalis alkaliaceticus]|uniref:flagellar hook-basal body protein n=1 Tax=Candidatus Contubernalis alkaliaceticus TaxID=338645 RepID=UPI001F4C14FD|nr:flagellar hook-basal body protein [Candidatus Contubernalis alkalaceticus]UNC91768.1 flagellar hook-basal body protein [Candidatus Contubernalis alkalaceticus]
MIRGIYTAARGMAVELKKQEILSNNLANSNTVGYKEDIALVHSFPELLTLRTEKGHAAVIGVSGQGALLSDIITRHLSGSLEETGRSFDLAIVGNGFYPVEGEAGQAEGTAFFMVAAPQGLRYTRDGSFSLDREGFLVTSDGYYVLGIDNEPLQINTDKVYIDAAGIIWLEDEQGVEEAGQLAIAVFALEDLQGLEKRGQNLFEAVEVNPMPQGLAEVRQGVLEQSNVNVLTEMINVIAGLRTYEANQKALQAQDEMLGKSVNEVGNLR